MTPTRKPTPVTRSIRQLRQQLSAVRKPALDEATRTELGRHAQEARSLLERGDVRGAVLVLAGIVTMGG